MPKRLTAGAAALAACTLVHAQPLPTGTPESAGVSSARLANIDAFFSAEIERQRGSGAVVAIARQGKLDYFKAVGMADAAMGLTMRIDTIFQLASMTKMQVAVGALAFTEQGKPPLQSKPADYFQAFGTMQVDVPAADGKFTTEPQKRPIPVHGLFRHTSGIPFGGRPDGSSAVAALWPSGGGGGAFGSMAD